MPDWSLAQPLTCAAASSTVPGELVSIVDTLPDLTFYQQHDASFDWVIERILQTLTVAYSVPSRPLNRAWGIMMGVMRIRSLSDGNRCGPSEGGA